MFKINFIISTIIFVSLLIFTSAVKNETRVIEKKILILSNKILLQEKI